MRRYSNSQPCGFEGTDGLYLTECQSDQPRYLRGGGEGRGGIPKFGRINLNVSGGGSIAQLRGGKLVLEGCVFDA